MKTKNRNKSESKEVFFYLLQDVRAQDKPFTLNQKSTDKCHIPLLGHNTSTQIPSTHFTSHALWYYSLFNLFTCAVTFCCANICCFEWMKNKTIHTLNWSVTKEYSSSICNQISLSDTFISHSFAASTALPSLSSSSSSCSCFGLEVGLFPEEAEIWQSTGHYAA